LFSQDGIEATSVRDIIKAAGANLGAINYHFGSKERLALEVFARRVQPVNRERVARLGALEAATDPRQITLEQILDALIRPAMESEAYGAKNCDDFMRLLSRSSQESNAEVKKFVEEQFAEVSQRFDAAIMRAVPGLPAGELFWRVSFLHGALNNALQTWLRFEQIPYAVFNPAASKPDREGLIQRLVAFIAAGLRARWDEAAVSAPSARPHTIPQ
jgi:AcrR family transcriptional regulator